MDGDVLRVTRVRICFVPLVLYKIGRYLQSRMFFLVLDSNPLCGISVFDMTETGFNYLPAALKFLFDACHVQFTCFDLYLLMHVPILGKGQATQITMQKRIPFRL